MKDLDNLCRELTFLRDGHKCVKTGSTQNLQWHHLTSRRYHSLRWRLENVLCVSAGTHLWFHHRPMDAVAWFNEKYPERVLALKETSPWAVNGRIDRRLAMAYLERERELMEGRRATDGQPNGGER